ncbi:MAG TPA: DUF748 domain-containing protein [Nitrospira sp.]|nr:DUF748 domain-containing protein [Nitrospira sp.]
MRTLLRRFRWLIIVASVLLIYALVGFFLVPYAIKSFVVPKIAEQLKHPVLVQDVEVNPFWLSLKLTGFEIREPDQSPMIGFQELFIDFETISLIRQAYVFERIRFAMPFVSARVMRDGRVNLAQLVPPHEVAPPQEPPKEKAQSGIPAVEIAHFEIYQGIVEFRDESKSRPFSLDIVPIGIVLKNFYTRPGGDNTYAFAAELGKDEIIAWEGKVSIDPIRSDGAVRVAGLKLPGLWQYVRDQFRFEITGGTLAAEGRYHLDMAAATPAIQLTKGFLHLADVAITEPGVLDPVITIPSFTVDDVEADLLERAVSIAAVEIRDGTWNAWLNPDRTLNYQSLFAPVDRPAAESDAASSESTPAKPATKPWSVLIKDIAVDHHAVHFEDRTLAKTAVTDITGLTVHTQDVHVPLQGKVPVTVAMTVNGTGQIHVDGEMALSPIETDFTVSLADVAIQPYQPYLERFTRGVVESGAIDVHGKLRLALQHPQSPFLTFQGNLGVKSLAVSDGEGTEAVSWKQFHVQGIGLSVDPTSVTIDEVALEQPSIHAVLSPDGQLNLSHLVSAAAPSSPAADKKSREPSAKAPAPTAAIKTVKLLKGSVTFRDESIEPHVRASIDDLTGTIKGLSSKEMARADVALSARVNRAAPIKISGKINPLTEDAYTDLAVTFDNVDLTPATPYSGKYAGYTLRKGKLFLDLAYKVSKRHLEAENKVKIDQLTFGDKTDSPDAVAIPVPLAVALLKDRRGVIDIDLPIRGDLNDPDFKYGKVVISTLLNLLTKLVASPFALVGKLVPGGGSGEDLQYIQFSPGSSEMSDAEKKKAGTLGEALGERPGLRLEIVGTADRRRDAEVLNQQKLADEIRTLWIKEHGNSSSARALSPEEEQRVIRQLYDAQRAHNASATGASAPAAAPTVDEMKRQLVAAMPVDEDALRTLARQRAEGIRLAITTEGKLSDDRIYMLEPEISESDHDMVRTQLNIGAVP